LSCICYHFGIPSFSHLVATKIEYRNATAVRQNIVNETAEARSARNARLETAEQGMGLTMPGGGVQAPTLGFDLDLFQMGAAAAARWDFVVCVFGCGRVQLVGR
jgi:hypothetical protein